MNTSEIDSVIAELIKQHDTTASKNICALFRCVSSVSEKFGHNSFELSVLCDAIVTYYQHMFNQLRKF